MPILGSTLLQNGPMGGPSYNGWWPCKGGFFSLRITYIKIRWQWVPI